MKIIPFRIEASKEEDNYSDVYAFLIKGESSDAYEVEIEIDSFNESGIIDTRCTCPHYQFRQTECKHILKAKETLIEYGVKMTYTAESANNGEIAQIWKDPKIIEMTRKMPPLSDTKQNTNEVEE